MAELIGGYCIPHDPLMTSAPNAADAEQASRIFEAFANVRNAISSQRVTTVVIVGNDHFGMFGPSCLPSLLIAIGDLEGPIEPWLGVQKRKVGNNSSLANHILRFGFERGFDWAVATSIGLDHATMVPVHFAVPEGVKVIPIYLAAGVHPLIRKERCRDLGQMLHDAIRAWPARERVMVLGTGGISHWVGLAEMGRVNSSFDAMILDMVARGDLNGLISLEDAFILENGGNGAFEIRNWIVAMAAVPGCTGRVLAYEAIEPWIAGLGIAELVPPTNTVASAVTTASKAL